MTIRNEHTREVPVSASDMDARLSTLGLPEDAVWPTEVWFPMRLKAPVEAGGSGGHGPVRYHASHRAPGEVTFAFDSILGSTRWEGSHSFSVQAAPRGCRLTHLVELRVPLWQGIQWYVLVGPLHDAVLEDLLDKAATGTPGRRWSPWIRALRRVFPLAARR